MIDSLLRLLLALEPDVFWIVWFATGVALLMAFLVAWGRLLFAWSESTRRRIERRYGSLIGPAIAGDAAALTALARIRPRHRLLITKMITLPLVHDRDPARIAATRHVVETMSVLSIADRYLRSRWWWRRTAALHLLGLIQDRSRMAQVIGALDDRNIDVRGAALDALADIQDPASLAAIVVRIQDTSLPRGRRAAALMAFGSRAEALLLELSQADAHNRRVYALALSFCGTERARPVLVQWTSDPRPDVRATVFQALAHVGLDEPAVAAAIDALESDAPSVRAAAARALRWSVNGDAAAHLSRRLDDVWPVAVASARTLQATRDGRAQLEAWAARTDLPGALARQMLWETRVQ